MRPTRPRTLGASARTLTASARTRGVPLRSGGKTAHVPTLARVPHDPAAVVAELETGLRPLVVAAYGAWWDANVAASTENEERRVAAELARSDFLADQESFAAVSAAREADAGDGLVRRQLDLLHDEMLPMQVPDDLRRRIVELEAAVERALRAAPRRAARRARGRQRHPSRPARERGRGRAAAGVGGVEDDRRGRRGGRPRARASSQRGRPFDRPPGLVRAFARHERARRTAALRHARGGRRGDGGAVRALEVGLDARLGERFRASPGELRPWHYDDPFFQELRCTAASTWIPC